MGSPFPSASFPLLFHSYSSPSSFPRSLFPFPSHSSPYLSFPKQPLPRRNRAYTGSASRRKENCAHLASKCLPFELERYEKPTCFHFRRHALCGVGPRASTSHPVSSVVMHLINEFQFPFVRHEFKLDSSLLWSSIRRTYGAQSFRVVFL